MVAICTGPAFSTDDAGNLITAGERRKANPTPCALKDANGLYTDPAGGLWTPDHVFMSTQDTQQYNPNVQITGAGGTIVPFQAYTKTYTNDTCWPMLLTVSALFGIWVAMSPNTEMWWELGSGINTTNVGFYVVQSQNFSTIPNLPYFDWMATHHQMVLRWQLAPHADVSVTVQSRMDLRIGSGTLINCTYQLTSWGFPITT